VITDGVVHQAVGEEEAKVLEASVREPEEKVTVVKTLG
jgi:hypothetical protein